MPSAPFKNRPPDQTQREYALDAARSILVRAPAGSGKTTLLAERFLRLLAEVDEPGQVVAITFTNAAAAEMRNRILDELRKDEPSPIARRALEHSQAHGWNLLDLPAQLRISTIDSFCRDLALQQPVLSGLGGSLETQEKPTELYRCAARRTLEQIAGGDPPLREAIESLLLWRDNSWHDLEDQLAGMLKKRDQWMHDFVLDRDPDWDAMRERLERPFANSLQPGLTRISEILDQIPGVREEVLELARYACEEPGPNSPRRLAELTDIPTGPFASIDAFDDAHNAFISLAEFILTGSGKLRDAVDKRLGFPTGPRAPKGFEKVSHAVLGSQMGRGTIQQKR